MKWYKFWSKQDKDGAGRKGSTKSINEEMLDMDFFCQLSYMAAIATSGISRSGLFHHAASLPYLSARYFKKAEFVAKAFNHDYSEACRIVGETTKEPEVKSFLLRLSGALSSGENITIFMERESQVFAESYSNSYERRLEVLRKWTDAYIALILTSAVVTVMAVVTMIIGNVTAGFIISLSALTIIVTVAGAWLIYHNAPRETKVHSLPYRSREQTLVRGLAKLCLPLGALVSVAVLAMNGDFGWAMIAAGVFLLPVGMVSRIDDKKIDKRDNEIAGFLRSLGGVSQAIRATVGEGIGRLDFRSMGSLKQDVDLLYTRLLAGINPHRCWERFVGETGSEQVNRSVRIFWDGVTLGGEPERVGNHASDFAMKIAHLRAQRGLIASGLQWLAIAMHAVLAIVVVFIYQTLVNFGALVADMMPEEGITQEMPGLSSWGLYASGSPELSMLHVMVMVILFVLTFANAFAIYSSGGGHIFKLTFYLAITMALSGAALVLVPPLVSVMLTGSF
jgi:flagellar protein FlaJ